MSRSRHAVRLERAPAGAVALAWRTRVVARWASIALAMAGALALAAVLVRAQWVTTAGGVVPLELVVYLHGDPAAALAARLLHALCNTVVVAVLGTAVAWLAGTAVGIVGAQSRVLQIPILGLAAAQAALPPVLLAVAAATALGPGLARWTLALAIALWPRFARASRAAWIDAGASGHVAAARTLELGPMRIALRHILPNALTATVPAVFAALAWAFALDAAMGLLGFGLPRSLVFLGGVMAVGGGAGALAAALLALLVLAAFAVASSARAAAGSSGS